MRRVLVTGASTPLGRRVASWLASQEGVETVVGVDGRDGRLVISGPASPTPRPGDTWTMSDLVDATAVDTIVHAALCPRRSGAASGECADLILTLQLAAAASGRPGPVRTVVAISSTEVYRAEARAPVWRREDEVLQPPPGSEAALVLEAEDYLRDVAEHQPHMSVAILRMADLVGPAVTSPIGSLLDGPFVPFVAGFDPPVQLLHVDDAVEAIMHAATRELAGTFNVAGTGVVHWRDAARLLGRLPFPVVGLPDGLAAAMSRLGLPHVPASLIDVLRFGRCADTTAFAASGFTSEHTTDAGIRAAARVPASRH